MAKDKMANSGSNANVITGPVSGGSQSLPKTMPISKSTLSKNKTP